ncbi:STAS domain-containing protein [Nocardioidaceae bacterium]|nr:STAS domain-containing protein [Nocardioidaceae bacterium]
MLERPFTSELDGDTLVLHGSVEYDAVIELRNLIAEHSEDHSKDLTIDLSDVDYFPSVAVGVIAKALAAAHEKGTTLDLVAKPGSVPQRVLTICAIPFKESREGTADASA